MIKIKKNENGNIEIIKCRGNGKNQLANFIEDLTKENEELKRELEVYKKALYISCEYIHKCSLFKSIDGYSINYIINDYISKAKEEIDNGEYE